MADHAPHRPSRTPPPSPDREPRFALGELVMVRSAIDPSRNVDCTRVIDRQWFDGEADWGRYTGWQYVVARHVDAWAVESSLRPRPEPGALGWSALRASLGTARTPRRRLEVRRARPEPTD